MPRNYTLENGKLYQERAEIPVFWSGDVIVAGGGPAGIGSALSSARNGCSTIIIEKHGYVGGMAAFGEGMPLGGAYPGYKKIGGIAEEILDSLRHAGPDSASVRDVKYFSLWFFHDPEYLRYLAGELLQQAGVKIMLHAMVVDVIMEGNTLRGVIIESKSGRQAVLAKATIDCTGDADIVAWAGGPFFTGDEGQKTMAFTLPYVMADVDVPRAWQSLDQDPRLVKATARALRDGLQLHADDKVWVLFNGIRPNTLYANNTRINGFDGSNTEEITLAELEARKRIAVHIAFFRKYVPGFEQAYVSKVGDQIGIRDTRRIRGEATLETADCISFKKRGDSVIRAAGPLDDVSRKKGGEGTESSVRQMQNDKDWYEVPYGALVPQGLDNILVAGRMFSSSHLAQAGTRGMGTMIGFGQVAGLAASIVAKKGIKAREVDVGELRRMLVEQGCDLDGTRSAEDHGDEKMYISGVIYPEND